MTHAEPKLHISVFFPGENQEATPNMVLATRSRIEWRWLFARLGNPPQGNFKEARGGWSPATFAGDERKLANVEQICAVVLDVDGGGLSFDDAVTKLGQRSAIVHTSWSHGVKGNCYRIVLRCSRPMTPDEYPLVWRHAARLLPGVDQSCKDASRLWFLPVKREGFRVRLVAGAPLDIDEIVAQEKELERQAAQQAERRPPVRLHVARTALVERAKRWLEKADPAISGSGGQAQTWRVCLALVKGFGLDTSTALELLKPWNDGCSPPWRIGELRRHLERAASESTISDGYLLERGAA